MPGIGFVTPKWIVTHKSRITGLKCSFYTKTFLKFFRQYTLTMTSCLFVCFHSKRILIELYKETCLFHFPMKIGLVSQKEILDLHKILLYRGNDRVRS